jgi:hypothetical protein
MLTEFLIEVETAIREHIPRMKINAILLDRIEPKNKSIKCAMFFSSPTLQPV